MRKNKSKIRKRKASVVAVVAGDIHLSHNAPACRGEKGADWYGAMERQFVQLERVRKDEAASRSHLPVSDIPIILVGDIFHKWNSPPELINLAIRLMKGRNYWTMPGQHDLPYHNPEDIRKSAYWTLVECGAVQHMEPGLWNFIAKAPIFFRAFHWGEELVPMHAETANNNYRYVALGHQYVWQTGHSFPGAEEDKHVTNVRDKLAGYSVAFFGDNHKGFVSSPPSAERRIKGLRNPTIVNCGGFMRREVGEVDYKPHVYLLYDNCAVSKVALDTAEDQFLLSEDAPEGKLDVSDLMDVIRMNDENGADFVSTLRSLTRTNSVTEACRRVIYQILDELQ